MKDAIKGIAITLGISIAIIYIITKIQGDKSSFSNKKLDKSGRKLVVGDSHAVGIGRKTKGVEVDSRIAVGGWRLSDLLNALSSYPTSDDVTMIFISIGTNGMYSSSDDINGLVKTLHSKFPNATLFAYKGSYGWSGSLSKSTLESRRNAYYDKMSNLGVTILNKGLGYFSDGGEAHTTSTPQSKAIISEIESIVL